MTTVQELLQRAVDLGSDTPRLDAEILLCHTLDKPRAWLFAWPEFEPSAAEVERYTLLLQRRAAGVPVAYLTGTRDFWTLSLAVNEDTLIPRPETETLVSWALELALPESAAVLDLGTGTGAIALALASERAGWQVTAVDRSAAALDVARANAQACGQPRIEFLLSDWFSSLGPRRFDLLVGNPPYIAADDPHLALGDVRFEPSQALVATLGGLSDLAHIAKTAPAHLQPGGWLLLEHGFEQGREVRELLKASGFMAIETRRDLAGQERITGGRIDAD